MDRDAWITEGANPTKVFIRSLLDVTDNLSTLPPTAPDRSPPEGVIARDGDDYYLVVAADKGTAAFSDTANAISAEYGFWLGDAFASGGSVGYDHKAMGITAAARGSPSNVTLPNSATTARAKNSPPWVLAICPATSSATA